MRHLYAMDHALIWMALSLAVGFVGGWRAKRRAADRKRLTSCGCTHCREMA